MKILKRIKNLFARDLGIDLGTANVLIYEKGNGIKLNQPSVVAIIDNGSVKIPYLFGDAAKMMIGRTPSNINIIRPMKDGAVADFHAVEEMIGHFVSQVTDSWKITRPLMVITVPYDATSTERIAIQDSAMKAGARDVYLVHEPIAAAIGANLPIGDHSGSMVVDIGGGTAEIAIIALSGIVCGKSIKIGGDKFTSAIIDYVKDKYGLLIGTSTAETIKEKIGAAYIPKNEVGKKMSIKGRDFSTGIPKQIQVTQEDFALSISDLVIDIVKAVKDVLDSAPPELASDISERGIVLTGGCSQIKGLDQVISDVISIPVFVAHNPLLCVCNGLGKIVDNFNLYSSVVFKQF